MTTATEARKLLSEIMTVFPKKKVADFFAHFNDLNLYLAEREREEKK